MMEKMPENSVEQPQQEKSKGMTLEELRAKVLDLQQKDRKREDGSVNDELQKIKPEVLTEEDARMWSVVQSWRDAPLSVEEMNRQVDAYTRSFVGEDGGLKRGIPEERNYFQQHLRSESGQIITPKQLEEMRQKRP